MCQKGSFIITMKPSLSDTQNAKNDNNTDSQHMTGSTFFLDLKWKENDNCGKGILVYEHERTADRTIYFSFDELAPEDLFESFLFDPISSNYRQDPISLLGARTKNETRLTQTGQGRSS